MVHMEGAPAFFARIESITPDHKPDWYHTKMLVLQVPMVTVTWILRRAYIDGDEFTMGGKPIRLLKVEPPEEDTAPEPDEEKPELVKKTPGETPRIEGSEKKVVSMMDRRKKDRT